MNFDNFSKPPSPGEEGYDFLRELPSNYTVSGAATPLMRDTEGILGERRPRSISPVDSRRTYSASSRGSHQHVHTASLK